ncbi:MAG: hypothetical protein JO197_03180 [Acidobacteria bacterium]|nr:hypothetical protein [Acidobacteriota bacterium]MBV9476614.1 hypothetical protein [Acidobacteriota bacterium]
MQSRIVMTASALAMGIAGVVALFAPQELLRAMSITADLVPTLLTQVTGSLYVGFAMVNWLAKNSLIGGIYNRPVSVGNFTHFAIGAITLLKVVIAHATPSLVIVTAIYTLFAIGFAMLVFGSGVKPAEAP